MEITVTQFKARCLGIIEKVQRDGDTVVITRHGRPAAELRPASHHEPAHLFGRAAKTTVIRGDLLTTGETWDAEA